MSICHFSNPACPHCRARNSLAPGQRRKWDALVRAFELMPPSTPAEVLTARADAILDRARQLEVERIAAHQ